jgi:hypothetical protein
MLAPLAGVTQIPANGESVRSFLVVIGLILILVLFLTNGIISGAFCVRGVGCLYSTDNGVKLDNTSNVKVQGGR